MSRKGNCLDNALMKNFLGTQDRVFSAEEIYIHGEFCAGVKGVHSVLQLDRVKLKLKD